MAGSTSDEAFLVGQGARGRWIIQVVEKMRDARHRRIAAQLIDRT
jgi:hypothetical protein